MNGRVVTVLTYKARVRTFVEKFELGTNRYHNYDDEINSERLCYYDLIHPVS